MPTHRDYPWERAAEPPPARPQPTWRVPIVLAVVGVAGLVAIFKIGAELPDPRPVPASAQPSAERVTRLRTRFVDPKTLEVWGRTSAPDGTTVRIRLRARGAGSGGAVRVAPAARRRFYAKVRLPRALRDRPLRITARLQR